MILEVPQRLIITIAAKERLSYALLALWLMSMISLPIFYWNFGTAILPIGMTIAAILQALAVFVLVKDASSWRFALKSLVLVGVFGWFAEFVGHRTGYPFGDYHYTDLLQPQIGGVPFLIPVAWFMLLPAAWVMAQMIIGEIDSLKQRLLFIGMSAIALTAWDLFLDPQMVAWNFWVWESPSGYFGIPYSNYLGWLLVAAVITALVNPPKLKVMPLALVYGIVWFLQSFGQALFWGQIAPAFVGCVAMGSILLAAYGRSRGR